MRHSFSDNDYGQGIPSKLNKVKRAANIGSLACPLAPMVWGSINASNFTDKMRFTPAMEDFDEGGPSELDENFYKT